MTTRPCRLRRAGNKHCVIDERTHAAGDDSIQPRQVRWDDNLQFQLSSHSPPLFSRESKPRGHAAVRSNIAVHECVLCAHSAHGGGGVRRSDFVIARVNIKDERHAVASACVWSLAWMCSLLLFLFPSPRG